MKTVIRRTETQADLSGAGERYIRTWVPLEPTRLMVIVHGYAEHSGRYDEMAQFFAERGFAVYAFDQSGHGRTAGPRGDVDHFERLLEEVNCFVDYASESHPGLAVNLVGHSMGALVAAATTLFKAPQIERLILSGALLELGPAGRGWRLAAARLLAPFGSAVGLAAGLDPQGLSRDSEVVRRYVEDPYVKDRMSARFASGMMAMIKRVRSAAPSLDRSVLLLHGEADPIVPASGSEFFFSELSDETRSRSELHVYPNLRHEIFQEPERVEIWNQMIDWIDA